MARTVFLARGRRWLVGPAWLGLMGGASFASAAEPPVPIAAPPAWTAEPLLPGAPPLPGPAAALPPPVSPAAPAPPLAPPAPELPAAAPPELAPELAPAEGSELRPRFELEARVISGFELEQDRPSGAQTEPGEKEYGFELDQARVGVSAELDRLRLNLSLELADALSRNTAAPDSPPYVRTAALEYRFSRALRLTAGRYKRPFSRLALDSRADIPVLDRGLLNGLLVEDNQWGDRAVGVMASGRLELAKLRWYLSLTNPGWSSSLRSEGVDVLARVQLSLAKGLTAGLNGGYKHLRLAGAGAGGDYFSIGADVGWKIAGAHLLLEGSFADLPFETGRPRGFGALLLADYELPLSSAWSLQPVAFVELADADAKLTQTESLKLAFGLNLLASGGLRVMPQLALVRSVGDTSQLNPWLEGETVSLIFSLAL